MHKHTINLASRQMEELYITNRMKRTRVHEQTQSPSPLKRLRGACREHKRKHQKCPVECPRRYNKFECEVVYDLLPRLKNYVDSKMIEPLVKEYQTKTNYFATKSR